MQTAWKISCVCSGSARGSTPWCLARDDDGIRIAGGWEGKGSAVVGAADLLCQRHACNGTEEMPCCVTTI